MTDLSDYQRGWTQGVADAGAKLIGAASAELGPDHPLLDRMVQRLGGLHVPTCTCGFLRDEVDPHATYCALHVPRDEDHG